VLALRGTQELSGLHEDMTVQKLISVQAAELFSVDQTRWVSERIQFLEKQHQEKLENVRFMYTKLENQVMVRSCIPDRPVF
jgi:hypothetical protein